MLPDKSGSDSVINKSVHTFSDLSAIIGALVREAADLDMKMHRVKVSLRVVRKELETEEARRCRGSPNGRQHDRSRHRPPSSYIATPGR